VHGATLSDLDSLRFQEEFLPASIHPDVIAENERTLEQRMQALGVINQKNEPTVLGILVCGKDPRAWLPGAYVQFVRYPGTEIGDEILDQKQIGGPISEQFRRVDEIVAANTTQAADLSGALQENHSSYPTIAVQELVRNAIIHRNYEGTASPVMLNWYSDRIELTSPGGPYGAVTAESFGQPGLTDARNPALASAAKALGFVQRFGSGIPRAKAALDKNKNPNLEFKIQPNFVNVTLRARQ